MSESPPNRFEGKKPGRERRSGQFGAGLGSMREQSLGVGSGNTLSLEPPRGGPGPDRTRSRRARKGPTFWSVPGLGLGPRVAGPNDAEGAPPCGVCLTDVPIN